MLNYIRSSINKFKTDALSKALYDSMKYLLLTFVLVLALKLVPVVKTFLSFEVSLSIWIILLISLTIIIFSFIVSHYIFQKKYTDLQLEHQTDDLTGLKNYKALKNDLDDLFKDHNQDDTSISIILIDIDNFKKFNDDYGYEKADQVLAKIGSLLKRDSRITDETYRYFMRGDEFLIIAQKTALAEGVLAAERKRKLISDTHLKIDHETFNLTVSCGVTQLVKNENPKDALERVNEALLNAKKAPNKKNTEAVA